MYHIQDAQYSSNFILFYRYLRYHMSCVILCTWLKWKPYALRRRIVPFFETSAGSFRLVTMTKNLYGSKNGVVGGGSVGRASDSRSKDLEVRTPSGAQEQIVSFSESKMLCWLVNRCAQPHRAYTHTIRMITYACWRPCSPCQESGGLWKQKRPNIHFKYN